MNTAFWDLSGGVTPRMLLGALVGAGLPVDVFRERIQTQLGQNWKLNLDDYREGHGQGWGASIEVQSGPSEMIIGELAAEMAQLGLPSATAKRGSEVLQLIADAAEGVDRVQLATAEWAETLCVLLGYDELSLKQSYRSSFCIGLETSTRVLSLLAGHTIRTRRDTHLPLSPLGVSLILTLAPADSDPPVLRLQRVGTGYDSPPSGSAMKAVRLLVGPAQTSSQDNHVYEVKATIDDMNPELYPSVLSSLQTKGALDSWWTGSVTKDGRPGATITTLVPKEHLHVIVEALLEETTTIGVRFHEVSRRVLPRREYTVETSLGDVGVKESTSPSGKVVRKAEFKDCVRLSERAGISVKEVRAIVDREIEEKRSR